MTARSGIERRVESAVRRALIGPCALFPAADDAPVLVAVSGGADSLALLYAMHRVCQGPQYARELVIGHYDHAIRGRAEGEAEAEAVGAHAATLGLRIIQGGAVWNGLRPTEERARRKRLSFLAEAGAQVGSTVIATGHTLTDQAETVLLRLIRGAGPRGLAGIDWRSPFPLDGDGADLVRPLLGVTRDETAAYCLARGIQPINDASNDDRRFARNRLRHDVLPVLRALNPAAEQAIARAAETMRAVTQLAGAAAAEAEPHLVHYRDRFAVIDQAGLYALPKATQHELIYRVLARVLRRKEAPDQAICRAIAGLAEAREERAISLPGGATARFHQAVIEVGWLAADATPSVDSSIVVSAPGQYHWDQWIVTVAEEAGGQAHGVGRWSVRLKRSLLNTGLEIGGRRPGERLAPVGMPGHKKIQDLLVDAHIPRARRDRLPIVRGGGRVAWVAGVRLAGWAVAAPEEAAVRVSITPAVS